MGLRMKNFHILRVHGKIRVLEGWVHEKPMCRRDCLKRGAWTEAWTVCRFKGGGLARKWEVVFLRGG